MGQEDGEGDWRVSKAGPATSRTNNIHGRGDRKVVLPQTGPEDPGPELATLNFSSSL